jgi:hypothetical protein
MTRYYFHVHDGTEILGREGVAFNSTDEARGEAVRASGAMLRDLGAAFWDSGTWRMWVTDETGQTVCSLRFAAERA